tara:strand:+ start:124 stop:306 length:183 start_codon:yes stop_codon:yes gene_type:complete
MIDIEIKPLQGIENIFISRSFLNGSEIHNLTADSNSIEEFISNYEFLFIEMFGENNFQYI